MKVDIKAEAGRLADDQRISDYEFWRTLKNINNEIFAIANSNEPIPIDIIRWRAVIKEVRARRGLG